MDIGIFIEYSGQVVQIPVNPQTFNVNTSGNNTTTEIITLGEIVIPKKLGVLFPLRRLVSCHSHQGRL